MYTLCLCPPRSSWRAELGTGGFLTFYIMKDGFICRFYRMNFTGGSFFNAPGLEIAYLKHFSLKVFFNINWKTANPKCPALWEWHHFFTAAFICTGDESSQPPTSSYAAISEKEAAKIVRYVAFIRSDRIIHNELIIHCLLLCRLSWHQPGANNDGKYTRSNCTNGILVFAFHSSHSLPAFILHTNKMRWIAACSINSLQHTTI